MSWGRPTRAAKEMAYFHLQDLPERIIPGEQSKARKRRYESDENKLHNCMFSQTSS
jgi:hypothetical protein